MKHALVIGLGVSGKASAALLLQQGFSVCAADRRWDRLPEDPEVKGLLGKGLRIIPDDPSYLTDPFSLAVLSPGIDPSHPLIQKTRVIEQIGEIELAFRYLPNRSILGVTGSNGKTTTVLLAAHIFHQSGRKAAALGNVGAALSGYALHPDPEEILVVELSSFQLEALRISPYFDAAAILNITPNHLNRHASMDEYAAAKLRLALCVKQGGKLFASSQAARDFPLPECEIFDAGSKSFLGSMDEAAAAKLQRGAPEWENVQAAKALCMFLGVSAKECELGADAFRKPCHRIEWVAEINRVAYYNDSKASNVEAVLHAVRLFPGPLILLAGGVDKGASYDPWIQVFREKVKKLVVFGEAAGKIERELSSSLALERAGSLREALDAAKRCAQPGDTVLLSPGCASYDQFRDYEHRGNAFKNMIGEEARKWIEKRP